MYYALYLNKIYNDIIEEIMVLSFYIHFEHSETKRMVKN